MRWAIRFRCVAVVWRNVRLIDGIGHVEALLVASEFMDEKRDCSALKPVQIKEKRPDSVRQHAE
jgi:hypothetical protein